MRYVVPAALVGLFGVSIVSASIATVGCGSSDAPGGVTPTKANDSPVPSASGHIGNPEPEHPGPPGPDVPPGNPGTKGGEHGPDPGSPTAHDGGATAPDDGTCNGLTPYAVKGPFVAGVKTIDVGGVVVEVWYPADEGAEAGKAHDVYDVRDWLAPGDKAKIPDAEAPTFETAAYRGLPMARRGTFPLVLFSHGLGGYRLQSSFLMAHLASWGFVVAAPEHKERGLAVVLEGDASKIQDLAPDQLRATIAYFKKEVGVPGSFFEKRVNTTKIALTAHSQGGAAISDVVTDDGITSWTLLASPGFGRGPTGKPLLMLAGTADAFANVGSMDSSYAKQPAGKRYVQIKDAVHLGFTDICLIGANRGGPLKIAQAHGITVPDLALQLITDGCKPTSLPIASGYPIMGNFLTAHLRATLGVDAQPVGMDDKAVKCFGNHIASYKQQ